MRRNWRDEARFAIAQLKGVGHGARELEMQAIARHLSNHSDTSALRRAIAAHEFLEHLRGSNPASYAHLETAPLSIVEIIARWFSFDPSAALAAAKSWADGIGNVRSIAEAMQQSRPPGYAGKTGIALGNAYAETAKPVIADAVSKLLGCDVTLTGTADREEAMGQTLDFTFAVSNSDAKGRIAVMIVGPYSNAKLYVSRSGDWVTRAFGLAWLFDRVVLALPDARALPKYLKKIEAVHRACQARSVGSESRSPSVAVVHIDVPKTTPEEDEMLSDLSRL